MFDLPLRIRLQRNDRKNERCAKEEEMISIFSSFFFNRKILLRIYSPICLNLHKNEMLSNVQITYNDGELI